MTREAKRLSRSEQQNRLELEKAFRDVSRQQEACKEQERGLDKLKRELEESLGAARDGREALEHERSEMLRGFQDVRMVLEVSFAARIRELEWHEYSRFRFRIARYFGAESFFSAPIHNKFPSLPCCLESFSCT